MPAEENTIFKKKEAAALAECAKAHSFLQKGGIAWSIPIKGNAAVEWQSMQKQ